MKVICVAISLFLASGCAQAPQRNSSSQATTATKMADSIITRKSDSAVTRKGDSIVTRHQSAISKNWLDSLMKKYLLLSKNELVRLAVNDKLSEEWLYDQTIETDTAEYFAYAIGHDVTDKEGARFITDQWVYVNSATRILYEVDLSKDSIILIRWPK